MQRFVKFKIAVKVVINGNTLKSKSHSNPNTGDSRSGLFPKTKLVVL